MESHNLQLSNQYNVLHNIDQGGKVVAEYVWIDGSGITLRSKCKTLDKKVFCLEDLPEWNYDGSSTYQATTENSEVILKPLAYFRDPFRQGDNVIVLAEGYVWADGKFDKLESAITGGLNSLGERFDKLASAMTEHLHRKP